MWKSTYADAINHIDGASVRRTATYCNGQAVDGTPVMPEKNDVKAIFYTDDKARIVNLPDGYVFTLPATDFTPDYSLSAQRSRYVSDRFILNVSYEDKNPYADRKEPWKIYLTEWLERYIANDHFLEDNNISRVRPITESTDILPGYVVRSYDMVINDAGDIAMPYYHVAIIREADNELTFYMMTMKATTDSSAMMDEMVRSFKEITKLGTAKNVETVYPCVVPDYWNDETKAYYEKLCKQDSTDWGFFSYSMPDIDDSCYDYQDGRITKEYARLSGLLNYEYAIMPTYTHLLYGRRENAFPIDMALKYANGNGFDGKPVLQYTYQFTASNNVDLADYTPTFDIMRGVYDEQLRKLARDIKAYRKPVLFRLNNEMNTDWTSYSGIVNLLDPDVFVLTWERLYRIFMEEGVDNTIWIFNPIAVSTPYCNWGEYLCFLPSMDTVQILGLTAYERGNTDLQTFEEHYRLLYAKNAPYFDKLPWVISEFGCGAGGTVTFNYEEVRWEYTEGGRHKEYQEQWVREMFECFARRNEPGYEFCKNIKGAVWFSCNDYAFVDGSEKVTNYFQLDEAVQATVDALRDGLANEKH